MLVQQDRRSTVGALLVAALAFWTSACAVPDAQQRPRELLLFSEIGNQLTQDSISVIAPDGSNPNVVLPRQAGRSFLYAHGNSLKTHLLALAHEVTPDRRVEDRLYLCLPGDGALHRLADQDGDAGFAGLAPDDERVAFEFIPAGRAGEIQLWAGDLEGRARALTSSPNVQDRFPVWRPDGSEIWFLRVRFSAGQLESSLMAISPAGDDPREIFGPSEHVGGIAFAPSNARFSMWTVRGLEIVDAATLARTVILPAASLPGYVLQAGSLAWSRRQDLIALALVNSQTGSSELWTVATDGANARPIYRVNQGRLFLGSFVEQ
jgi:hypothetical protein